MSIPIYKNVVEWDDSAAIEAFHAAKSRFWAKINRMPCSIPLPDPNMYIDKINYDAVIDPKLIADLENEYVSNIDEQYNAEDPVASSCDAAEQGSVNWDKFIPRNETASWIAKRNSDIARTWKSDGASHLRDFVNGWGSGDWEHRRQVHPWENGIDSSWGNCQNQNNSWGGWKNKNNEPCGRIGQKRDRDYQCYQGGKYRTNNRTNNRWSDNRESKRAMYSSQPLSMR